MTTTRPQLVLLHGALGARNQLDPLAAALAPQFEVHQLEFEGHGSTAQQARPFRMEHFVENVLGALDERGIERASLFGYSMGGYVALLLAASHPTRVERVITLGTKFRWDPATASREVSRLNPAVIRAKVPQFADALAERHRDGGGWERVLASTAELLGDLGDHPRLTDDVLRSIRVPVTVTVGGRDNTVSVDETRGVARVLRRGTLMVLENTTHPIEQLDVAALAEVVATAT